MSNSGRGLECLRNSTYNLSHDSSTPATILARYLSYVTAVPTVSRIEHVKYSMRCEYLI
jgi:hypothetical protein